MKEMTTLCDVCKEKVAKAKCCLCKNDVCMGCARMFGIGKESSFTREFIFDVRLWKTTEEEKKVINIICMNCLRNLYERIDRFGKTNPRNKKIFNLKVLKFFKENLESIVVADKL